jgi:hypothetical protein
LIHTAGAVLQTVYVSICGAECRQSAGFLPRAQQNLLALTGFETRCFLSGISFADQVGPPRGGYLK